VHNALHNDPRLQAAIAEALTGFYRREIEAGNTRNPAAVGSHCLVSEDGPQLVCDPLRVPVKRRFKIAALGRS
jgi:hypothetical protein